MFSAVSINACKRHNQSIKAPVLQNILKQETPQCDETRFSTIQPSVDMTGIRNETWQ